MSKFLLNLSPLFQLFLPIQLFRSLRCNRRNRWNSLPVLPIPKKRLHSIYYSSVLTLPVPGNYLKECSLRLNSVRISETRRDQRRPIDPSKATCPSVILPMLRMLAYHFCNGSSLIPSWWKDVSCSFPSFVYSRYTVVSQNSIPLCHFQCL